MRFSFTIGGGVFLLPALWAVPAGAVISPVGPFVGTYSETWESFPRFLPSQTYLPNPSDIMGGFASISNAWMDVFQPTAGDHFSLQSNGFAIPSDGVKAMGLDFYPTSATITFGRADHQLRRLLGRVVHLQWR
jgi:hypothetical protein